jgi:hypothetical protein
MQSSFLCISRLLPKKKAVPPLSGNQLCELALATRRSASSGPVAFRHPITRVLALSCANFDERLWFSLRNTKGAKTGPKTRQFKINDNSISYWNPSFYRDPQMTNIVRFCDKITLNQPVWSRTADSDLKIILKRLKKPFIRLKPFWKMPIKNIYLKRTISS